MNRIGELWRYLNEVRLGYRQRKADCEACSDDLPGQGRHPTFTTV